MIVVITLSLCCILQAINNLPDIADEVDTMSWIWKIGFCFCGCSGDGNDDLALVKRQSHVPHRVIQRQPDRRRLLLRSDSVKANHLDSTSMSCSGYQTFGCGSSYSGDDSDDEGSVDLKKPFKSKLNTLHEEGPSVSDEIDQVLSLLP